MIRDSQKHGFTLVELLVVIAIIAILAGILLPAMVGALGKADKAKAQNEVKGIDSAIRAYYTEYSKLPAADADQGDPDRLFSEAESKDCIARLGTNNPRRIIFLEIPQGASDGTFLDPWDTQYRVMLDLNYDSEIIVQTNKLFAPAAAISAGPDKDITTTADNIYSFK